MPKFTKKFLTSLIKSVSSIAGVTPPEEDLAIIEVLLDIIVKHQENPEFKSFLQTKIQELSNAISQWEETHIKAEEEVQST